MKKRVWRKTHEASSCESSSSGGVFWKWLTVSARVKMRATRTSAALMGSTTLTGGAILERLVRLLGGRQPTLKPPSTDPKNSKRGVLQDFISPTVDARPARCPGGSAMIRSVSEPGHHVKNLDEEKDAPHQPSEGTEDESPTGLDVHGTARGHQP